MPDIYNKDRLIVALDVDTEDKALSLVNILKDDVKFFKVGLELFASCGPYIINKIKDKGCEVFLDLKFHDIPNTVAKAAVSVTRLGAYMFNVHALGGYDMMKKAAEAVQAEARKLKVERPHILAVTILTSMDMKGLKQIGINAGVRSQVLRLAKMAKSAGLDGVVASPGEAALIRKSLGRDFIIATPGVRPEWAASQDQKRIATPRAAIAAGADFIVVGRPIIESQDILLAAKKILQEIP